MRNFLNTIGIVIGLIIIFVVPVVWFIYNFFSKQEIIIQNFSEALPVIIILASIVIPICIISKKFKIRRHDYLKIGQIMGFMWGKDLALNIMWINNIGYSLGEKPNKLSEDLYSLEELSDENLGYLFATFIKEDKFNIDIMGYLIFLTASAEQPEVAEERYEQISDILTNHINWMDIDSYMQAVENRTYNQYFLKQIKKKLNDSHYKISIYKQSVISKKIFGTKEPIIKPVYHTY